MVQTDNHETGFFDYSSDTENIYLLRRGRLKMLISVEKMGKNIPESGDKESFDSPDNCMKLMEKILKGEHNAKIKQN